MVSNAIYWFTGDTYPISPGGPPTADGLPPRRANLSAPGSRFVRAEDAFTTDTPPKPAGIAFVRASAPVPKLIGGTLWEKTGVFISANPADTSPSLALDHRRLLYCAFSRVSSSAGGSDGVYLKRSDDYGDTWNPEIMAIPNGIQPAMASKSGKLLLAALSGTDKTGYTVFVCVKGAGDKTFNPAKAATVIGGGALLAEKSGLALASADEGPDRWVLSLVLKGETETSEWWSVDDASWTRISTA